MARLKSCTIFEIDRDQFQCKMWIRKFLVIHTHDMGALHHFHKLPSCCKYPQRGMTSYWNDFRATGAINIPNCKYCNVNFSLCIYLVTNLLKTDIWRFQNIQSHPILLHFAFNKKLMKTETFFPTKSMVLP